MAIQILEALEIINYIITSKGYGPIDQTTLEDLGFNENDSLEVIEQYGYDFVAEMRSIKAEINSN